MGTAGLPDKIGFIPVVINSKMVGTQIAIFVGIEVKQPFAWSKQSKLLSSYRGLTDLQRKWKSFFKRHGALYFTVRSADALKKIMKRVNKCAMREQS